VWVYNSDRSTGRHLRQTGRLTGDLVAVGTSRAGTADGPESSPEVLSAHAVQREVDAEVRNEEHVRYMLQNGQVLL
jgi:hypothetical protein